MESSHEIRDRSTRATTALAGRDKLWRPGAGGKRDAAHAVEIEGVAARASDLMESGRRLYLLFPGNFRVAK
jgi:hypothetical protein